MELETGRAEFGSVAVHSNSIICSSASTWLMWIMFFSFRFEKLWILHLENSSPIYTFPSDICDFKMIGWNSIKTRGFLQPISIVLFFRLYQTKPCLLIQCCWIYYNLHMYFANVSFWSSCVEVELPSVERLWGPATTSRTSKLLRSRETKPTCSCQRLACRPCPWGPWRPPSGLQRFELAAWRESNGLLRCMLGSSESQRSSHTQSQATEGGLVPWQVDLSRESLEHFYLEGRVNHVELGIKVFNELEIFNEGGQHFVVLIADLNIEL